MLSPVNHDGAYGNALGASACSLARIRKLSTRPCASPGRSMPVMVPSPYAVASY